MIETKGKTKYDLQHYIDRLIDLGAGPSKSLSETLEDFNILSFKVETAYLGVDMNNTVKFGFVPDDFNMYWELKASARELVENSFGEDSIFIDNLNESLNRLDGY